VRCPGIHLEVRVRDELGRAICVAKGKDLVDISVQDQGRDVDRFQVLAHIGLGERLDGKVRGGEAG